MGIHVYNSSPWKEKQKNHYRYSTAEGHLTSTGVTTAMFYRTEKARTQQPQKPCNVSPGDGSKSENLRPAWVRNLIP